MTKQQRFIVENIDLSPETLIFTTLLGYGVLTNMQIQSLVSQQPAARNTSFCTIVKQKSPKDISNIIDALKPTQLNMANVFQQLYEETIKKCDIK